MNRPESEVWPWRVTYGAALVLVLIAFLYSLQSILNPFLLFLLLALLVSPFAGTRTHLLLIASAGLLTLIWLLETTGFLLAPFLLSVAFAYIFHPLVQRLERHRLPRAAAIGVLALPLLGLLALAAFVGVPALSHQIVRFLENLPEILQASAARVERLQLELAVRDLPFVDEEALLERLRSVTPESVFGFVESRRAAVARWAWQGAMGAGRGLGTVLTILGYVVLTPILTFYLLRDWDRILARLATLVPRARAPQILGFAARYDRLLSRYLRGQLLAAALVGVLTGVGFWLVSFPYALLLGVVAGVFNIVPYLGLIVSLVPALVIALFSGSVLASLGKIALVFGVVQILDGSVVGPRIVGESVGLHPVWVILALTVSGFFFGFVGLLLAIPLAVMVKLVLLVALERYQRSALFHGPPA